jgi:hypothetical protein
LADIRRPRISTVVELREKKTESAGVEPELKAGRMGETPSGEISQCLRWKRQ